jgi:hypothetical protein
MTYIAMPQGVMPSVAPAAAAPVAAAAESTA